MSRFRILVMALCVMTPISLSAQDTTARVAVYTFGGAQWGASRADVTTALSHIGFVPDTSADDPTTEYAGDLLEFPARVQALYGPTGLLRLTVIIDTPDAQVDEGFTDLQKIMVEKWGPSRTCPSVDGSMTCYWGAAAPAAVSRITLETSDDHAVVVTYEAPAFAAWDRARIAKARAAF